MAPVSPMSPMWPPYPYQRDTNISALPEGIGYVERSTPEKCQQGLCGEDQTSPPDGYKDQYNEVLNSHHAHFVRHKALWDAERKVMSARIAELEEKLPELEERLLRYIEAKPVPGKLDSNKYGIYPTTTSHTSQLRERAGNETGLGAGGNREGAPIAENKNKNVPPQLQRTLSEELLRLDLRYKPKVPYSSYGRSKGGITSKTATNSSGSRSTQSGLSTDPTLPPRGSPRTSQLHPPPKFPQNFTQDAGHTPLAHTRFGFDGNASAADSNLSTPTKPMGWENPPPEPPASLRRPSERAGSYFPPPSDDPELKGPLGITSDGPSNDRFVNELKSRMQQVAQNSSPPRAASAPGVPHTPSQDEFPSFDQL
ncbi:MAG: hypothetical protein L6R40_002128 [Gallowayella cf. fulva]|nr:MAG: hypothetical protein L6R40_002128 [Xanthomendoza cf. fulva]